MYPLCFYVLRAFLPSLRGRARYADLRIKTSPDEGFQEAEGPNPCDEHWLSKRLRTRCSEPKAGTCAARATATKTDLNGSIRVPQIVSFVMAPLVS